MSMKPCKKSDLNKKWMSDRRDRRITIAPEYHLIVTEGTKTEPQYFEGLKEDINRLYRGRISIVIEGVGQGANKTHLPCWNVLRKLLKMTPINISTYG